MVDIVENINALLEIQGLDLTEVLDHNTLSNLLIECRDEIERLQKSEHDLRYCFEKVLMDIKFIIEKNRVFDDHIYQSAFKLMTDEFMKEFNNG